MNQNPDRLTREQVVGLLEELRDPNLARQFLVEAGLIGLDNRLTPPYRSSGNHGPKTNKEMEHPKLDQTSVEVRNAALFVVAALSPSFLISVLAVIVYLSNSYPAIGSIVNKTIENLVGKLSKRDSEQS